MRVLFYLPVVTNWWVTKLVAPMLRQFVGRAEIHVLAPAPWRTTGIGPAELGLCADMPQVHWHLVDGEGHPAMRTGKDADGLVEFVQALAPDLTLCRAAETETAARFPGTVRYLMETGVAPFVRDLRVSLHAGIFDHGTMPAIPEAEGQELDRLFAPAWDAMVARCGEGPDFGADRETALARMLLPSDRKILAVPLEYENSEIFFGVHHRFADNETLVAHLVANLPDDMVLALSDHPLNRMFGRSTWLAARLPEWQGRVVLVPSHAAGGNVTDLLARHCDGMVFQNSRAFTAAAFFGKPLLRLSRRTSAPWLHAYDDLANFVADVRAGTAQVADRDALRRWFAWHLADEVFDPNHESAPAMLARIDRPYDPARWQAWHQTYLASQRPKEAEHA
jgi:hypothetical protein